MWAELLPTQLVQPLVADAEVVRHLMYDRRTHLLLHLLRRATYPADLVTVDRDTVGEHTGVPLSAFRERDTVVETEQPGLRSMVLDNDGYVLHQLTQLLRDTIQGVRYQLLKLFARYLHHMGIVSDHTRPSITCGMSG